MKSCEPLEALTETVNDATLADVRVSYNPNADGRFNVLVPAIVAKQLEQYICPLRRRPGVPAHRLSLGVAEVLALALGGRLEGNRGILVAQIS